MRRTLRPRANPARKPTRELPEIAALMRARSRQRIQPPQEPIGDQLWRFIMLRRMIVGAFVISTVAVGGYAALRSAFDFMP